MKKIKIEMVAIFIYLNFLLTCFSIIEVRAEGTGTKTYWNGYEFYILDYSCWDSGGHIDWEYKGDTYLDNIKDAVEMWNTAAKSVSLSRCKSIFRKDNWKKVCDVTIKDYNKKDSMNGSISIDGLGFGVMKLNEYYMSGYTYDVCTAIVVHEFGHSLGMGDDYSHKKCIMYGRTPQVTYITDRDKAGLEYEMRNHTTYFG